MKNQVGSRFVKLVVTLVIVFGGVWALLNTQALVDWVRLQTYTPGADIKQLADNGKLTGHARNLFYVSDPKLQDSAEFNDSCSATEQSIVLGCYKSQQIYLYNIRDSRFNGIKEVTAAHEMLHAAYDRLSEADKHRINTLLKPIIDDMKDPRILDLIALYNKTEPGELYNEMHAILGTEYATLTPALEEYYKKYFEDRQVIIGYANQYQAVFTESENKIKEYDRQLGELKPQIDQNNAALEGMQNELQAESNQLNAYRLRGQIDQYNSIVPVYNAKVARFNALIEQTQAMVERHNAMVEERNNQVTAQAKLYDSINSNYQKVNQN